MAPIFLSIVLPCLNEARTLPVCISKAQAYLKILDSRGLNGEVIVADNGSTDGSLELASTRRAMFTQRSEATATRCRLELRRPAANT